MRDATVFFRVAEASNRPGHGPGDVKVSLFGMLLRGVYRWSETSPLSHEVSVFRSRFGIEKPVR